MLYLGTVCAVIASQALVVKFTPVKMKTVVSSSGESGFRNFVFDAVVACPHFTLRELGTFYKNSYLPIMDATDQSNLLSSIKLMKELKDLIMCQYNNP